MLSLAGHFIVPLGIVAVLVAALYSGPWIALAAFALLLVALILIDDRTAKWVSVDGVNPWSWTGIAERYEQAATIVTSNLDFTEWDQAFPANPDGHPKLLHLWPGQTPPSEQAAGRGEVTSRESEDEAR